MEPVSTIERFLCPAGKLSGSLQSRPARRASLRGCRDTDGASRHLERQRRWHTFNHLSRDDQRKGNKAAPI
jgi:hypothetical protein